MRGDAVSTFFEKKVEPKSFPKDSKKVAVSGFEMVGI